MTPPTAGPRADQARCALEAALASPSGWDEVLAMRGLEPGLVRELEGLPASPLLAARLGQAHLVTGRTDLALQALRGGGPHPLLAAARLAVHAARSDYLPVLGVEGAGPTAAAPLELEARARERHAVALALWGTHRFADGAGVARTAAEAAEGCGMRHFARACQALHEDCVALRDGTEPAERERQLRAALDGAGSEEERVERLIELVQLMYRRARYDEAARLSAGVPPGRQGRRFREMTLVAAGHGDELDWGGMEGGLEHGRLRAVHGLMRLDAAFVLAGPAPRDEAPLTARHAAEWSLSFGWAALEAGALERAAEYLAAPFVHRSEWDLRLVRGACWLELYCLEPALALGRCNVPAVAAEALGLLRARLWPRSVLVQRLPLAVPSAAALLAAAPGGCGPLSEPARLGLALLDGRGLTVAGLTRTRADSMVRVAGGREAEPPALSNGATRAARSRLKKLLAAHGPARLVAGWRVLRALEGLGGAADGEEGAAWRSAAADFARRHALESTPPPER